MSEAVSPSLPPTEYTPDDCLPLMWPAQCQCGHLYLNVGGNLQSYFVVNIPERRVWRAFLWCGFCRTRIDWKDIPWPEAAAQGGKES